MLDPAPDISSSQARLAELIEAQPRWMSFLISRVADLATAEDILQSAYIRAMEHAEDLQNHENTMAWFYSVLRNAVIDHFRRNATRERTAQTVSAETPEGYDLEFGNHACACLHDVVADLKPEYRSALESVDLGEQAIEDFAREQGISANNVSVRLHRARRSLAKNLSAVCGACAKRNCVDCTCKKQAE